MQLDLGDRNSLVTSIKLLTFMCLQVKAEKEMSTGADANREEVDARSVYVGNVRP